MPWRLLRTAASCLRFEHLWEHKFVFSSPLLVLKGHYDYCTVCSFSRGLEQMEVDFAKRSTICEMALWELLALNQQASHLSTTLKAWTCTVLAEGSEISPMLFLPGLPLFWLKPLDQ